MKISNNSLSIDRHSEVKYMYLNFKNSSILIINCLKVYTVSIIVQLQSFGRKGAGAKKCMACKIFKSILASVQGPSLQLAEDLETEDQSPVWADL